MPKIFFTLKPISMGSLKDDWMDEQNERSYQRKIEKLATHYGFNADEVDGLEVDIDHNTGNDDFVYGWYVQFPEETPQHIKDRVGQNGFATLPLDFFEEEGDHDDEHDGIDDDGPDEGGSGFIDMPADEAMKLAREARKSQAEQEGEDGKS